MIDKPNGPEDGLCGFWMLGASAEVEPSLAALMRTFEKIYFDRALVFEASCAPGLR